MNDIKKAIEIATKAHKGQKDKSGVDYIQHPKFVVSKVNDEKSKIVAWLHDTLEDSKITGDYLREFFTDDIVTAIELLTKKPNENYQPYLSKIKKNTLARNVKLADLSHNMDISRIKNPTFTDYLRLDKYKEAYEFLK